MINTFTDEQRYDAPIVTQVVAAGPWYEAEPYHQEHFSRNPYQGYGQFVVSPKVAMFRQQFADRLKA